ncbi:MAG: capsular biosynthesis protein [Methylococcaceae bacterium]
MKRSFLFLQGVCSPFFTRLADVLQAQGHSVHKINFTVGDVLYWLPRPAEYFRGNLNELPDFIATVWEKYGITDQVLFGDCRPVHQSAVNRAEQFGIRTHVFEEGYFRPHWITLEREGVNGHSLLPRDPDWFAQVGKRIPNPVKPQAFRSPFYIRAFHDVLYNFAGLSNCLFFPHYQSHVPYWAFLEYAAYIRRFILIKLRENKDSHYISWVLNDNTPFYVLPLQLGSDAQIRQHSRFADMREVIEEVLQSFALHAPTNSRLVIKNHPLDAGLINYRKIINRLARQFNLTGRVFYLKSGDLNALLKKAAGTVTVNSTVGGLALSLGCPTIALSDAIYNLPNLTFQGRLDDFWHHATPPDAELFRCFRNAVIHSTQLNGGFYCKTGINLAVSQAVAVLTAEQSPLEKLLDLKL